MKNSRLAPDLYGGRNPREIPVYSAGEAAHYLRIPENTVRSWLYGRAYSTTRELSFDNLVELYAYAASRQTSKRKHGDIAAVSDAHLKRIEWSEEGVAVRIFPITQRRTNSPRLVAIDPLVAFGRPVIAGSRIPTSDIADRFKAGESPADLAYDYGRDQADIEEAIRCELHTAA